MAEFVKNLEALVAREASHSPIMDEVASKVESYVIGGAPVEEGDFVHSIKQKTVTSKRGIKDRVIYSDDPQAHIIEYGHMAKNGRWVPGHFAFGRAVMAVKFGG